MVSATAPLVVGDLLLESERADQGTTEWGLYFTRVGTELAKRAAQLERIVFLDEFGNDEELMDREYGPHDDHSLFATVVHHPSGELVAVMRLLYGPAEDLKTLQDVKNPPWGFDLDAIADHHSIDLRSKRVVDIATISVLPAWRTVSGGIITQILIGALWPATVLLDADVWITVIDERAARVITYLSGLQFVPICDSSPVEYLDSPRSFAGIYDLTNFWEDLRMRYAATEAVVTRTGPMVGLVSVPTIDLREASKRLPDVILL